MVLVRPNGIGEMGKINFSLKKLLSFDADGTLTAPKAGFDCVWVKGPEEMLRGLQSLGSLGKGNL